MIILLLWFATFVGQPIPFSHKQHATQACDGCHKLAPSGEVVSIPTGKECMTCHSEVAKKSPAIQDLKTYVDNKQPIPWVRVYELPSFVDFNHKTHLSAGAKCETCHGPVATRDRITVETDISMGGCMDCHRTAKATISCNGCHHLRA